MTKNRILNKIFLFCVFAFLYLPIVIVIVYSFNESKTIGHWTGFSLDWYKKLFSNQTILQSLVFTLAVALIATFVSTILGTFASIGIFFSKYRPQKFLLALNQIPIVSPDIVLGISYMLFFLFLKIPFGTASVLIAHIMFSVPVVIVSIMPRLNTMDLDLISAAEDLGANFWQTLRVAVIPSITPGIISGAIMAFTFSLDDFVVTYFTAGEGVSTLSIQIYTQIKRQVSPELNALSALMFIAVLLCAGIYAVYSSKKGRKKSNPIPVDFT